MSDYPHDNGPGKYYFKINGKWTEAHGSPRLVVPIFEPGGFGQETFDWNVRVNDNPCPSDTIVCYVRLRHPAFGPFIAKVHISRELMEDSEYNYLDALVSMGEKCMAQEIEAAPPGVVPWTVRPS